MKYNVKINWVSEKEIFKSSFIKVNAGDIIVIPITGTATIINALSFNGNPAGITSVDVQLDS